MLYIVSLFEQSVDVRDLGLLSPTKSYHLGLGPIRTTGAPAVSWQLIIFSILLNSLLLSVANILHTRYHCRRIARLATSGGIVASMWLNVVGCVRIESWVRINRVCLFSNRVIIKFHLYHGNGNIKKTEYPEQGSRIN
jgi:hypothetical protein